MTNFATMLPVPSPSLIPSSMATYSSETVQIIQGQYVGSTDSSKGQLKWLQIQHDQGTCWVKLPKAIGYSLMGNLQPGTLLTVWVRPKKDYFKALMVIPVPNSQAHGNPDQGLANQELINQPRAETSQNTQELVFQGLSPHRLKEPTENSGPTRPHSLPSIPPDGLTPATPTSPRQVCTLKVCTKGKCSKRGSHQLLQALTTAITTQNLEDKVGITATGCLKNCNHGPTIFVSPDYAIYSAVRVQDLPDILSRHITTKPS